MTCMCLFAKGKDILNFKNLNFEFQGSLVV